MRSRDMQIIAAMACASLGVAIGPAGDDVGLRLTRRTPSRKPGQPHAGTREIERRQRQEARLAARAGA